MKIFSQVLELFHACRQNNFDAHVSDTRTRLPIYHVSCSNEALDVSCALDTAVCSGTESHLLADLVSTPNSHKHGMTSQLSPWDKNILMVLKRRGVPTFELTWDF